MTKEGALVVGCLTWGSRGVGDGGTPDIQAFMCRSHCVTDLSGVALWLGESGGGTRDWWGWTIG
eukprot:10160239-Alexandrium_andersonii.AAC.1